MTVLYKLRHVICAVIAILGLYALLGFIVGPYLIKSYVVPKLAEKLGRPVLLQDVEVNPFTLSVRLVGLDIQEQDRTSVLGFDELFVNFEAISLLRRVYGFDEIRIVRPFALVKIRSDGTLNLVSLVPPAEEPPPPQQPKAPLPPIEIDLLQVKLGVMEYRDESKRRPVSIDVVPIELTLHKFTTQPGVGNAHSFTAEFGQGERLRWDGVFTLEPLESHGTLALANIRLPGFWKKIEDQFKFDVRSGDLNVDLRYSFDTLASPVNLRVSDGKIALTNLAAGEKGTVEPLVSLGGLTFEGVGFDLAAQTANLGIVASTQGRVRGWMQPDGTINYVSLFAAPPDETNAERPRAPDPPQSSSTPAPARQTKSWSLVADSVRLDDFAVKWEDRTVEPKAELSLDEIRFTSEQVHVPFTKPVAFNSELKVNQTGQLEAKGTVGMNPIQADLNIGLAHLALPPFQPYVNKFLLADLSKGEFNLNGQVTYSAAGGNGPRLTYRGNTSVVNFEVRDRMARSPATIGEVSDRMARSPGAVGGLFKKPVLSWSSLALNKVALDLEPTSIAVEEIEWRTPSVRAVTEPDGTLNVTQMRVGNGESTEPASDKRTEQKSKTSQTQVTPVNIGLFKLHKASLSFTDRSIEPAVSTGIQNLTGTIKGLSSKETARANVSMTGTVDRVAPLKIHGQINPLSADAYTNLLFAFDNMDLTAVSPYSGKYAGYPINKGTMHLDMRYKVLHKQLEGENKVIIDQFTFGESTNSPDATSLPVRLAVALLKDRHGKIDVDLPVRGDLNDPDYRYGRVVWKAILNLITKIGTSPFAALGSLAGGTDKGEDLQYVEFEPGESSLTEHEQQKVQSLSKALTERPALRVEVVGNVDQKLDRRALAERRLTSLVLDRFRQRSKGSSQSMPTPEREFDLLSELYIERFGKQPMKRQEDGSGRSSERVMQRDEIREALVEATEVSEEDLRELAQARAGEMRQQLVQQADQVDEETVVTNVELTASGNDMVRCRLNLIGS